MLWNDFPNQKLLSTDSGVKKLITCQQTNARCMLLKVCACVINRRHVCFSSETFNLLFKYMLFKYMCTSFIECNVVWLVVKIFCCMFLRYLLVNLRQTVSSIIKACIKFTVQHIQALFHVSCRYCVLTTCIFKPRVVYMFQTGKKNP